MEEIAEIIGVDSLGYLSLDSAYKLCNGNNCKGFCAACFGGAYPTAIPKLPTKTAFEKKISENREEPPMNNNSYSEAYAQAGVDITAGYKAVELMKSHIARTNTPGVVSDIGGFGGPLLPGPHRYDGPYAGFRH